MVVGSILLRLLCQHCQFSRTSITGAVKISGKLSAVAAANVDLLGLQELP